MVTDRNFLLRLAQQDPSELDPGDQHNADLLTRLEVSRPLVMINTSTSGMVAGSMDTREAVQQYAEERSIEIDLAETGSIGLSSEDPVVSVQIPGYTRLFFARITSRQPP